MLKLAVIEVDDGGEETTRAAAGDAAGRTDWQTT